MNSKSIFRAWDKQHKIMLYDDFDVTSDGRVVAYNSRADRPFSDPAKLIVMRFIGLLDIKGRRIFESDLIKNSATGAIKLVKFQITQMYSGFNVGANRTGRASYEIIGNMYQDSGIKLIKERILKK